MFSLPSSSWGRTISWWTLSPDPIRSRVRMDPQAGGVSGSVQKVAGDDRPVCHLSKSPLFALFFTLPRSEGSWDRCSSSELVLDSAGSEETLLVLRSPHDSGGPILASEALVFRPVGSGGGRSSTAFFVSKSSQTTALHCHLLGIRQG